MPRKLRRVRRERAKQFQRETRTIKERGAGSPTPEGPSRGGILRPRPRPWVRERLHHLPHQKPRQGRHILAHGESRVRQSLASQRLCGFSLKSARARLRAAPPGRSTESRAASPPRSASRDSHARSTISIPRFASPSRPSPGSDKSGDEEEPVQSRHARRRRRGTRARVLAHAAPRPFRAAESLGSKTLRQALIGSQEPRHSV